MTDMKNPRSGAVALGGLALIVLGLWWLVRSTGLIPPAILSTISDSIGALTLIGLGVVVLVFSRKGAFALPKPGTRLYRSRSDRWLGGVVGGLGAYLGIDTTVLRIVVVLLAILGAWVLVPAYIVMWIVVPEEPFAAPAGPVPPVSNTTGV